MAIIGQLIKTAIEFKERITTSDSPVEVQRGILKELLETASSTSFGIYYAFDELLEQKNVEQAFKENVPFFDYNSMYDRWWNRTVKDLSNITWPGKMRFFALSSGTTGSQSKRIPVSDEMLEAIRGTALDQITAMANFDLPSDFFEKEILMLGSSTELKKVGEHLEGEISGISASNIPNWFDGYYKPGKEISAIEDWDQRITKIAEQAANWDIGAISGIPAWVELMLKKIIEYNNLKNIHELWPNLQVYTSGGVAFEPYRKSFERLLAHPIYVVDTYLASEGFLAYQNLPNTNCMKLALDDGIYFEFVPFKPENINEDGSINEKALSLNIADVEENVDYALVISTVAGAWRYLIGDTIKFTNKKRAEIIITGRTKHFLNVVGEQLSVIKMNEAIQALQEKLNTEIKEFTVGTVQNEKNERFYHQWFIGCEGEFNDRESAKFLDEYLKNANKAYRVSRTKALADVKVNMIPNEVFYSWNERNKKKGGQVKMPRVMKEKDLKDFEDFVKGEHQLATE